MAIAGSAGKLTKATIRDLRQAADNRLGVLTPHPSWGGLQRASWHARMSRHVADGMFSSYVHGGYEITDAGRAALAQQEAET